MGPHRAIFFDKDGPLVDAGGPERRIRLAPTAVSALHSLAGRGFRFVVASHQPGVAHGRFPLGALDAVAEHLGDLFLANDLRLDGCYWCPHDPGGSVEDYAFRCTCRKPMPGLLQHAAHELAVDLGRSWVIGSTSDVEAGRRAGCRTVLARDLLSAARAIERFEQQAA